MANLGAVIWRESGFATVIRSSADVKLLFLQRFVRLFAYGSTFIILVQFLSSLGISDRIIGLFLMLTLFGDTAISLVLSQITDRVGRRRILAVGAVLMTSSGVVFALSSSFWILLLASVIGVISPSGNEIGPFRAIEESILSHVTEEKVRSDVFAWYSICGSAGAALGTLTAGWTLQALQRLHKWSVTDSYRAMFALYAVVGIIKFGLVLLMSRAVESDHHQPVPIPQDEPEEDDQDPERSSPAVEQDAEGAPSLPTEETPLIDREHSTEAEPAPRRSTLGSLLPSYSQATLSILLRLLPLFTMDSLASGLAAPSWLTDFFVVRHALAPSALGTLFFATNVLATLSNLAALPIARRLGPLRTMTFTHLPSAVCLALVALPPPGHPGTAVAMLLLALRATTQTMDQAPRQAFLAAVVLPGERTAVYGVVNTVKTMAQAGGVGVAGTLASGGWWLALFGGAGVLKASYDILLLTLFYTSGVREGR